MLILCTNACTYWHKGNRKILCLAAWDRNMFLKLHPNDALIFSIYSPVFVHTISLLNSVHSVDRLCCFLLIRGTT